MLNTAPAAGGWTVCPICGAIVADTWAHANWHETTLADVIADIIEATTAAPAEDQEDTE
ncbi:hypothetical protein [Actinomyces succiniciruminis]|uniref:Uncharacterized protein n=1 Tax=Actinomyces succiniciruminis TaxID=1522002 RepID=A0A1L7RIJ0_9ACTO|nr:hypothetical protein [Actinomyces succiniciruminis]CED90629.1 Hypothetical protein AAM4_0797 [Actinomyces succiniciruminis]